MATSMRTARLATALGSTACRRPRSPSSPAASRNAGGVASDAPAQRARGAGSGTPATSRSIPPRTRTRVNLGCGYDKRPGYLNVDLHGFHDPDLVGDVRSLPELPTRPLQGDRRPGRPRAPRPRRRPGRTRRVAAARGARRAARPARARPARRCCAGSEREDNPDHHRARHPPPVRHAGLQRRLPPQRLHRPPALRRAVPCRLRSGRDGAARRVAVGGRGDAPARRALGLVWGPGFYPRETRTAAAWADAEARAHDLLRRRRTPSRSGSTLVARAPRRCAHTALDRGSGDWPSSRRARRPSPPPVSCASRRAPAPTDSACTPRASRPTTAGFSPCGSRAACCASVSWREHRGARDAGRPRRRPAGARSSPAADVSKTFRLPHQQLLDAEGAGAAPVPLAHRSTSCTRSGHQRRHRGGRVLRHRRAATAPGKSTLLKCLAGIYEVDAGDDRRQRPPVAVHRARRRLQPRPHRARERAHQRDHARAHAPSRRGSASTRSSPSPSSRSSSTSSSRTTRRA